MLRFVSVALSLSLLLVIPPASAQSSSQADVSPVPSVDTAEAEPSRQGSPLPGTTASTAEPPSSDRWTAPDPDVYEHVGAGSGTFKPYERESTVYRMAPPVRYNRVEGVVLGLRRAPLKLSSQDHARVFGQLGYAFALRDLRYTVGVESQLYSTRTTGLKVGALYQKQTLSPDRWKTSYLENSLASLGFKHDFFDYYEAEGFSMYGVHALPSSFEVTGGVRTEVHRSLSKHTNWSVFNSGRFHPNPHIDEGRMQSVFGSVSGGRVRDLDDLPTGGAFRVSATLTNRPDDPLSFARYEADGRVYLPLTIDSRLAFRVRGGYATSEAPPYTQFSIGGIGSVRSYEQNQFRGTRMLLANTEYLIDGATVFDPLLDDLFLVGLLDAGWVGGPTERVHLDEVIPSAGVGIGLDERRIRLDVSWPLRDLPRAVSGPSLWLRIAPNF